MSETESVSLEKLSKQMLKQMSDFRAEVAKETKVRTRAQELIYQLLDEAAEYLFKENLSDQLINSADYKMQMAKQKFAEAQKQKLPLALLISLWMLAALGISGCIIADCGLLPSLSDMPINQLMLGAVIWGTVGAAIDGLRELHTRYARQELDPNRAIWYFAHPIVGAGLGAIIFLVVFAGLLSVGQTQILPSGTDEGGFNPAIVFLLAALVGFEEQSVIRYLRDTVRHIFRIEEKEPHEGG